MDVYAMGSDLRLYNESDFAAETELENWVEFRELAVEGIRLCQEDFTCAVV
jgi:hypothetical protein